MAQLAIKAHPIRTKEVIEILEMLGGKNRYHFKGDEDEWFVLNENIQRTDRLFTEKGFTLEEFLEKYPYKVGDKVRFSDSNTPFTISRIWWDNNASELICTLEEQDIDVSSVDLQPYKEETMKEKGILVAIDLTKELKVADKVEVILGDYEFVLKDGKTYFIKKRPKYPKTYEECCEVLSLNSERATWGIEGLEYKRRLIVCFQRLLICRDAYWKIAGEQMGFGKPWEYDMSKDEFSSAISYQYGYIQKCEIRHQNKILIFPTEEMRDTFYENFKELIEFVKELL